MFTKVLFPNKVALRLWVDVNLRVNIIGPGDHAGK